MKFGNLPVYWVINFKKEAEIAPLPEERPLIEFTIPQPDGELFLTPTSKTKALDFLREMQQLSQWYKEKEPDHTPEEKSEPEYQKKMVDINEDLKDLFSIIQELANLMKRIKPKKEPPEDPSE